MKPIKVELFAPSSDPRVHVRTKVILCPSNRSARRLAAQELGTIEATQYTVARELERAPGARIESRRGRGIWMGPRVRIVASVGELGWSP
jgi:hypothetical protein